MEKIYITSVLYLTIPIILLVWYMNFHIKRLRLYKLAAKFNGPPTIPFFGNALSCFVPLEAIRDIIINSMGSYESPSKLWIGTKLILHVWDPKQLEIVLNSPYSLNKHPFAYRTLTSSVKSGLFGLSVQPWKRHRRHVAPILSKTNVGGFCNAFSKHSKALVKELSCMIDKDAFDVRSYLIKATFAGTLEALMDLEINESKVNINHFLDSVEEIQEEAVLRLTNVLYFSDTVYNLLRGKKFRDVEARANDYMDTIVEQWQKKRSLQQVKDSQENAETETVRPVKRADYLLTDDEFNGDAGLPYDEAIDEAKTLLVGGFESTATMLGFILIALGLYPDVQEQLYREIQGIIDANGEWKYSELENLDYLDRVVKETLRIFTPGAGTARITTHDIQLDDRIIPAGTSLLIGMLATHSDPNIWPNPSKFDPDRFLPEAVAGRHPYSWMPFLGGVRNCVGFRYALLFMKVAAVELVRVYHITTSYKDINDIKQKWMLFFKPIDGFNIGLQLR